jgi:hypothetical protein
MVELTHEPAEPPEKHSERTLGSSPSRVPRFIALCSGTGHQHKTWLCSVRRGNLLCRREGSVTLQQTPKGQSNYLPAVASAMIELQ